MARNYKQGRFVPQHPEKYAGNVSMISYRSSWELKFMLWCDKNPSVLKWGSEEIIIPYYNKIDNKYHRYFVDNIIRVKRADGSIKTYLVEIKPDTQTKPPVKGNKKNKTFLTECITYETNVAKWTAAKEYASKKGWEFIILTEHHLGIV